MHGPVSPPNNTGDALRMAMAHGADLANMGEAWWVPVIQIPGDTLGGQPRSRSVRLERTRPRSIIVNKSGNRFINEASDYNSMASAFQYLHPGTVIVNDPAWIVFDDQHLKRYGIPGRRARRRGSGLVQQVPRPDRTRREDRYRRRRPDPHRGGLERASSRIRPIHVTPNSAVAQALTTDTGAIRTRRPRPARRWARWTPARSTRCRWRSARWAPRAVPRTTGTAG